MDINSKLTEYPLRNEEMGGVGCMLISWRFGVCRCMNAFSFPFEENAAWFMRIVQATGEVT